MNFMDNLRLECIQIGSSARNKSEVLHEIAGLAKKSRLISSYSARDIFRALEARENIGSTGFERGIAIPHCSLEKLDEFVIGLLVIPDGIDFQSSDGLKTKVFFFIIGSKSRRSQHIQILSSISKLLKSPDIIDRLIGAKDNASIMGILLSVVDYREEMRKRREECLFQVFIQNEEYFNDILQVFSAAVQGSISVIETNNAGYYLHRLPLFASFWTEKTKTFNRIIMAVVDKDLMNDVIRRINMIVEDIHREPGVLITVQDLSYTSGSIEF